jgi:hypothetical protein
VEADVGTQIVAVGTVSLHANCRYSAAAVVKRKLARSVVQVSGDVLSVLVRFLGNRLILPDLVREVKGAPTCTASKKRADVLLEDDLYKKYLQPAGFSGRTSADPTRAFNPITGQNAAWDDTKRQWIDTKTLKPLSPAGTDKRADVLLEDDLYKKYLQPAGFSGRTSADPTRAFNPTTGQNAAWDNGTLQWIDVKTGKVLGSACGSKTSLPPKPTITPIHAVFTPSTVPGCSPPACTTVYTENATGQDLTYQWTVSIPADPNCAAGFHPNQPQLNQATWYHADESEGGPCNHSGTTYDPTGHGHPGTVVVVVSNSAWTCTATYFGTQGDQGNPVGDGDPPQPCKQKSNP